MPFDMMQLVHSFPHEAVMPKKQKQLNLSRPNLYFINHAENRGACKMIPQGYTQPNPELY